MRLHSNIRLILFLWVCSTPLLNAQNGQYDVRFTLQSMSCDSSKATIAVQIRAHDMAHAFNLGDANFRFEYDTRLLTTPTIASQVNFSSQAPSSNFNYGSQNLNGSSAGPTKGIVSLNTFYTGVASGARRVDTTWTTVSHIRFNVVGGTDCFPMTWNNEQTVPATGMNEVQLLQNGEYNLYIVASGGVYTNIQSCFQTFCNTPAFPPTVQVSPIVTKQDSTVTVCMPISDPDLNSSFTAIVCGVAKNGTATPSVNGSQLCVQYAPSTGFAGSDSVCISVCDNTSRCTNITIPITVNIRPSAPTIVATAIVTKQDSTVTVCTTISDRDEGSTFTATVCGVAKHGTATPSVNGSQLCVQYTPATSFAGSDSVCITVCDNTNLCSNIRIPITVNTRPSAPTVAATAIVTKQDSTVTVCTTISDPDPGSTFTATLCNETLHGTATPSVNGNQLCITYVPTANYAGSDAVCVRVCDNTGLCTNISIPITINTRPHAPTITVVPIVTKEDSTVTVCLTMNDQDANTTFITSVCGEPKHGTVNAIVNGNQLCVTYIPTAAFKGQDSICVRICDNTQLCINATIPITVNPRPHAPTVAPLSIMTWQDSTVTACSIITDLDEGAFFTATLCNEPIGGSTSVLVNNNQLCVRYVPTGRFIGQAYICVNVCDNTGLCTQISVPVTVQRRPTAPSVAQLNITTKQDSTVTVCSIISDLDENSTFTSTVCHQGTHGTATPSVNGNQLCVRYAPNAAFYGKDSVCIRVCDNTGLCTEVVVPINITQRQTPPTIEVTPISMKMDTSGHFCYTITDAQGGPFTATLCNEISGINVTPSVDGHQLCLNVVSGSVAATTVVCVRVCDSTGLCTNVQIPVTVQPKHDGRLLVGIHKTLAPNQPTEVRFGNSVNYKITVVNKSTFAIMDVLVRDSIPTGMVLNQSNPQGWTLDTTHTLAVKTIPTIASGDSVTLDISLILLYGNPRSHIMNRAFVFHASDQIGDAVIQSGQEPKDTASFMVKPFDPMGTIYCENTGFVLKGGHIELVSAPSGGSIFFATDTSGAMLDGTSGEYQFFTNGVPGRYEVRYVHPNNYPLSTRCLPVAIDLDPTNNDGDITDANGDGVIDRDSIVNGVLTVGSSMINGNHLQDATCSSNPYWLTFDLAADDPFVFHNNLPIGCATIKGSTVGIDLNENGILDNGESPLTGIKVQLFDTNDLVTPIDSTTTDGLGKYIFDGLSQSSYQLKFIKPNGYRFAIQNANSNLTDTDDSDADATTGWTRTIALNWGDVDSTIGALFVPTNINQPSITGTHIVTKEDSVLNICIPILDNTPIETFTPSVCGVQNGVISNVVINNRKLCFTYTPTFGYRGDDTLCLQVCDRDGQCDTARFTLDIQAKNNRFDCRGDTTKPVITFTHPLLNGVRNGDTLTSTCTNPNTFGIGDVSVTDNNDPNPRIAFGDAVTIGNCLQNGYKALITNTWTATDSCGNVTVLKFYIKLRDTVKPVLAATPTDITVNLTNGETIPIAPSVSATDNCGTATVTMTRDSVPTGQNCDYVMTRTWTATDECGNTATRSQRITVLKACSCTPPNAKATIRNATCGAANGIATILVDNALNYTYAWSANNGTGSGNARSNLASGTYTVTVSRINDPSCQAVVTATVGNNTVLCCTDFIPSTEKLVTTSNCGAILDVCITMSNTNITSVTDNGTPYTTGLTACTNGLNVKLNVGTHILIFKTTTGCYDTIEVKIVCASPMPQTIETMMVINTKDSIALQTNELAGTRFTLRKISSSTVGSVDYIVLPGTMIVTRSAKAMGQDNATYVVSDEYGFTDTTYFKTEVVSRTATRRPLAVNDIVESVKGKSIFIDVMQNDSVLGTFKSLSIVSKPKNGSAVLTSDNRIAYVPTNGFCGKDEMKYALCNGNGCDTGTVSISVLCEGVKVYNGFSPNGDGVNDNFVIEGIESYPNNSLKIYNRWGTEVLTVKGYKNDWQGTWNGTNLPDGTYFYLFDDGKDKVYKGFVQLLH